MSLDGFITVPNDNHSQPPGEGGEQLLNLLPPGEILDAQHGILIHNKILT